MPPATLIAPFRPIPAALIERIETHLRSLADADNEPDTLRALFLLHSELKDCESLLPPAPVSMESLRSELRRAETAMADVQGRMIAFKKNLT